MKMICAAALTLVVSCCVAQSKMVKGYIVTTAGETLQGYILDQNNKWNGNSITFSATPKGEGRVYRLHEIAYMHLEPYSASFYSRIVQIDKKPVDMTQIERDGQRKIVTDTVLLEVIAMGKLNLFQHIDEKMKRHFFIQHDDGKIEELPYVVYLSTTGRLVEMPFHQGTLQGLTTDCSSMKGVTPNAYAEKALKNYVVQYNECVGISNAASTKKSEGIKVVPFFAGGVSMGRGSFDGNEAGTTSGSDDSNGPYSSTTSPTFNLGIEFVSARVSNRTAPGIQIAYQKPGETVRRTSTSVYSMKMTMLHFGAFLKFYLAPPSAFRPYAKVNFSVVSQKVEAIRTSTLSPRRTFSEARPTGFSYSGSVGVKWKMLSFEGRVQDCILPAVQTAKANFRSVDLLLSVYLNN